MLHALCARTTPTAGWPTGASCRHAGTDCAQRRFLQAGARPLQIPPAPRRRSRHQAQLDAQAWLSQLNQQVMASGRLSATNSSQPTWRCSPRAPVRARIDEGNGPAQPWPHLGHWLQRWLDSALFCRIMQRHPRLGAGHGLRHAGWVADARAGAHSAAPAPRTMSRCCWWKIIGSGTMAPTVLDAAHLWPPGTPLIRLFLEPQNTNVISRLPSKARARPRWSASAPGSAAPRKAPTGRPARQRRLAPQAADHGRAEGRIHHQQDGA